MAGRMAGNAQNLPLKQAPGCGMVSITLAKMCAITAKFGGKRRIVIEKEGNIPVPRDRHKAFGSTRNFVFGCIFEA
jgi:hypothetical protein